MSLGRVDEPRTPGAADAWSEAGRFLRTGGAAPAWRASWIGPDAGVPRGAAGLLFLFRHRFECADPDAFGPLHVSADSRYKLWVNGVAVGRGPARWSNAHRVYESYDVRELLREGANALAAEVLFWGPRGPTFNVCVRPALVAQSDAVATGAAWRLLAVEGYNPDGPPSIPNLFYVAGNWMEALDARTIPAGWREPEFDDGAWARATELAPAGADDAPWRLFPRAIPAMEERPPVPARPIERGTIEPPRPAPPFDYVTVPAPMPLEHPVELEGNGRVQYLVYDAGRVVTAFPVLELEAPAGARVELMYAEAPSVNAVKTLRDCFGGQRVEGYTDAYVTREGRQRLEPHLHRTFWYVRVAIRSEGPVRVHGLSYRWTAYPFSIADDAAGSIAGDAAGSIAGAAAGSIAGEGRFACSDANLEEIWRVGWYTCRLCSHETFEDSPYYEQLQYVGDARIQALITYYVSGDARLAETAIRQLGEARTELGLLPSRYPCSVTQVIPGFSLLWISMLEEHWLHTGRTELARELMPAAEEVLATFGRHEDAQGLLRDVPGWNFLDWSFLRAAEPNLPGDVCTPLSMLYKGALDAAARLCEALGDGDRAAVHRARARRLRRALNAQTWSESRGLYLDGVVNRGASTHTNALAVLCDVADPAREERLARRLFASPPLRRTTFYFDFYVHRAMEQLGRPDLLLAHVRRWNVMLELGASTWFETIGAPRSDCHAWTASPTYDLLTTVLGVRLEAPGLRRVRIEPFPGGLTWARGTVATPRGPIAVEWHDRRGAGGAFELEVELPEDTEARVVTPDGTVHAAWAGRASFRGAERGSRPRSG